MQEPNEEQEGQKRKINKKIIRNLLMVSVIITMSLLIDLRLASKAIDPPVQMMCNIFLTGNFLTLTLQVYVTAVKFLKKTSYCYAVPAHATMTNS